MKKKRLEYIEGFKGFACLCVLLAHFIGAFCNVWLTCLPERIHNGSWFESWIGTTPFNLFYNGNFGVRVFFITSGFVLSYAFFKNGDETYLKKGALKRYFRLVLPVATVNIAMFLLMKTGLLFHQDAAMISKSYDWLVVFNDFEPSLFGMLKEAFVGNFFTYSSEYVGPLWTMTYEMLGSLLVFAFLALFGKEKIRYIVYIVFLTLFQESNYSQFLVGVAICDIMQNQQGFLEKYRSKKWAVALTFLVGLLFSSYPSGVDPSITIYRWFNLNQWMDTVTVYHFIGATLLFFAILNSNLLQKFFELKPFAFLGKYSFGLYLVHWPVMLSLSSYIIVKYTGGALSYYKVVLIDFIITMIVIAALAMLLVNFVDAKGIKLANLVAEKAFPKEKKHESQ
ncbi:MAG: acyltransferase [Lachnospiraceae bacterium]|nr:acyltransferase [Lachnospiraceae bacterium]